MAERGSFWRAAAGRIGASLVGATAAGLIAALTEVVWSRGAASQPPGFGSTLVAVLGLTTPLTLAVGLGVGALVVLLHPPAPPSLARLAHALRAPAPERRAYLAALLPLALIGVVCWILLAARLALGVLAIEAPEDSPDTAAGPALALGAAVTFLVLALLVLGAAGALGARLRARPPDPVVTGLIGAILAAAVLGYAIASGDTSGAGGTLPMFGVFKRPELDLRAPGLLLLIAAAAYLGQAPLARLPLRFALVLAALPLGLTWYAASRGLEERRLALTIERGAPLAKLLLAPLRKASDGDRDGFSARFGGGDCNDADPAINPRADDVPGNGRDEDCSGADAESLKLAAPAAKAAPKDARTHALEKLPEKLNVVLISIDTLRHDLGYLGNPRPLSPNLDRLAKKSVVFEKAYSLASYTSKSLPPMLIGKYGSETHRGFSHFNRFGKEDTFIQERLKAAGIRTISVQGFWYFYQAGVGLERGFDVLDYSAAPKAIQGEGDKTFNADKLSDAAIAQLEKPENTQGQFYLWVHYTDPHTEYVRHPEFDFGPGMRERYDSEVAFVDKHVGRVIEHIEKSPFAARTAIVVTSDHGEAFGEHGMIRHGFEVWEELVRVPLIFNLPGAEPRRVTERRGQIDLVPTVLDLFRLPQPSGEGFDFLSGESLLLDLFMPPGYQPAEKIVFVDMTSGPNNSERQAFIENHLKLVTSSGRALGLYDLEHDAAEKNDLMESDPERGKAVLDRFKAFRRNLREVRVREKKD
jgi:choline-sulfatase